MWNAGQTTARTVGGPAGVPGRVDLGATWVRSALMSDPSAAEQPEVVTPEIVDEGGDAGEGVESVSSPAKVMRIGAMVKALLEEVRTASPDEPGRDRLKAIFEQSIDQLKESLSPDLANELASLAPPFSSVTPTEAELRIAQAQLVGWLEGLFHGIQATLFAQQMAARQQLEQMRGQLPPGTDAAADPNARPGTYL
jgi:hypothetical protein